MSIEEINGILSDLFQKSTEPEDIPTQQDWHFLESKFRCKFNEDFIKFMDAVSAYQFPGEIYSVATRNDIRHNGDIASIYDLEVSYKDDVPWDADLLPFCGIGNGDCLCISVSKSRQAPVYYVHHEDGHSQRIAINFKDWLLRLNELYG